MNPAGAGTNIIQQALPSPISPISPYASWASSGDEDPLEQFVDALGAGTTVRTSTPIGNAPPAGAGTPARLSPVMSPQASAVGVGGTTPRRLTAAERGKQAAGPAGRVAQKQPRRTARPPTPSSPVMPEVEDEAVPVTVAVDEVVEVTEAVAVVEVTEVAEVVVVEEVTVVAVTMMTMTETRPLRP